MLLETKKKKNVYSQHADTLGYYSDNGIIRTLDQPVYMASVKEKSLLVLDREGKAVQMAIDPTEYKFKLALLHRKYEQVLYIIRHSNLVGQAIIGYLQQKGYPEIALHFVRDDSTRFELALECGNLDVAMETAQKLNTKENWERLGSEALRHGNFSMVELAYQRIKHYDRLLFLYLVSGNEANLRQMMKIAQLQADPMSRFQNAMYLGDIKERIQVLQDVGQVPLAYLTARSHGLDELAQSILARAGKTEADDIELPDRPVESATPHLLQTVAPLQDPNWPLLTLSKSFFEGVFAANNNSSNNQNQTASTPVPVFSYDQGIDDIEEAGGDWGTGDDDLLGATTSKKQDLLQDHHKENEDEDGEGGWDDDGDIHAEITAEISNVAAKETAKFVVPVAGFNEAYMWVQTSRLAVDYIAAGSFEVAMQVCVFIKPICHG